MNQSPYYLRARYYDPLIGRFLTRDPFVGFSTIPQSLNRYPYVQSNPASLIDPYGLCGWKDPWTCVGEGVNKASDIAYDLMPENAQFFFDFATGTGNADRSYGLFPWDKAKGFAGSLINKGIDYVTDPQQIGTGLQIAGLFVASKACPAGFTVVTGSLCVAGVAAYGAGTFIKWRDTSQDVHSGRCSPSQGKARDILAVLPLPGNPVTKWFEGKVLAPILDKLYSGYAEGAEACESPPSGSGGPKE